MPFINENFLLQGPAAQRLYTRHAAGQPILDYHNHLPVKDIAEDRPFRDVTELWLEGDHYKWRAMRANGIPETCITGSASPYDKFLAWAQTVPYTLRNPLFHWTHLELKRYFDIDEILNPSSAPRIWAKANAIIQSGELTPRSILRKFNVQIVCTTDDPTDSLIFHRQIASNPFGTAVLPAFRPDRIFRTQDPPDFNAYVDRLGETADVHISTLADLLTAFQRRHEFFHACGCRLSDHGLESCPALFPTENEAAAIFTELRQGRAITPEQSEKFAGHLMVYFAQLDASRGWTKQLHLGALRNVNRSMLEKLGPDTGYDSIGDFPQASKLAAYLARVAEIGTLPKMVLYNLNPADNYVFAAMVGNFQEGSLPARIQYGSAWWFLDQKEGIEAQLNALSHVGLLSRFVGMLTDSRSFMSFPRHEYFRRVLCNMLGREIESGELPDDDALISRMITDICYGNAQHFFGFGETGPT